MARHSKAEAHSKPHAPRSRPAQSRAASLDRLIHEPIRLGIVSALAVNETMTFNELKELYSSSLFFRTLMDNCEMAMKKSYFPLTAYLSNDPQYGEIWNKIYAEFELTLKYLFLLSGKNELMADYPVEQLSIQMRERIVLPLTTIQQYAINRIRELESTNADNPIKESLERLVVRCSFGIINAGRNSV